LPNEDVYRCPAGEKLTYRYTNEESGRTLVNGPRNLLTLGRVIFLTWRGGDQPFA
jgi:hypothetical protein